MRDQARKHFCSLNWSQRAAEILSGLNDIQQVRSGDPDLNKHLKTPADPQAVLCERGKKTSKEDLYEV